MDALDDIRWEQLVYITKDGELHCMKCTWTEKVEGYVFRGPGLEKVKPIVQKHLKEDRKSVV